MKKAADSSAPGAGAVDRRTFLKQVGALGAGTAGLFVGPSAAIR